MRVVNAARLVYLNPPRTASTTIDRILRKNGMQVWKPRTYAGHATVWKPEWDDYFVFLSVRSPWTRAVSLWRRTVEALQYRTPQERKVLQQGKISFAEHLLSDYHQVWWGHVVAHNFTAGAPRVDLVVHQETLDSDFQKIPRVQWHKLPRNNVSRDQSPWHQHYDSRSIEIVREVFAKDFEEYGYTTDFEQARKGNVFQ